MEPYFEIDKELVDALILEIHLEFVRKRGDVTRVIWSRKQEFYGFKLGEFSLMQSNLREALIFWWLIRDLENMSVHKAYAKFLFLHKYVYSISRNKYMVIVAMVESLSTDVFREWLWQENIDFMSEESFLRRLSEAQINGLREWYKYIVKECSALESLLNMEGVQVCECRVRDLFGPWGDSERRYSKKSAWACRAFGFKIGPNLYDSVGSDEKNRAFNVPSFALLKDRMSGLLTKKV